MGGAVQQAGALALVEVLSLFVHFDRCMPFAVVANRRVGVVDWWDALASCCSCLHTSKAGGTTAKAIKFNGVLQIVP